MEERVGVVGYTGVIGKQRLAGGHDRRLKKSYIDYLVSKSKNIKIRKEK
jgi:hypothetical protein